MNDDSLQVLLGGAESFVIMTFGIIILYTTQILIARFSGPVEFGIYAYAWTIATLFSLLLPIGLNETVLRLIPSYSAKNQWSKVKGVLLMTPMFVFAIGFVVAVLGIAIVFNINQIIPDGYHWPLYFAFAVLPFLATINLFQGIGRALGKIRIALIPKAIGIPLFTISALGLWIIYSAPPTAKDIMSILLAACIFLVIIQGVLLIKERPKETVNVKPVFETQAWLRVSFTMLLISGAQLTLLYADILMVGYFMGPIDVAVYHAAARTALLISGALMAMNSLAAPKIAQFHSKGRITDLQELISSLIQWIFWPSAILAIVLIVYGDFILSIFGEEFTIGHIALIVLSIGQLINAGAGPVGYLMTMTGNQNYCAIVFLCSAILNIILNAILIPSFGIIGAAIATTVTIICWNCWLVVLVRKRLNIRSYIFAKT